ncbi:hypothetical protein [Micromonospora sp. NPDC005324]|uniref:hypothetical protein n=1 Tax=Micromonospora sp. NPDC005324 TaxID=3157033 RepID=UPI0033BD41A5
MPFTAGQPLLASQLNDLEVFAIPKVVVKTSDESVASSIAPQDDNELLLSVAANTAYRLQMHLLLLSAGTAGDLRFRFNAPAGSRLSASAAGLEVGATGQTGSMQAAAIQDVTSFPTADFGFGAVGTVVGIICSGTLIVGGTAGTFRLQWAQWASSATATTIKAGSALELSRYA